jgi:hypothetical protein
MMNVNMDRTGSVLWIMVTCAETVVNAAGVTVLLYVCSCTTVHVRALYKRAFLINIYRSEQDRKKGR